MDTTTARTSDHAVLAFEDGLGKRYRLKAEGDHQVEVLCFPSELTDVPSFEFALRERVNRLSTFQHPSYAQIRKVDRLKDGSNSLALFSEFTPSVRLSELIAHAERRPLKIETSIAVGVIHQLIATAAILNQHAHVINGALGPERVLVTPQSRLVVTEYVLGAALEHLRYSRERYWKELRVPLPLTDGVARFDPNSEVEQLGMMALALLLGRLIHDDEFPDAIEDLVAAACSRHAHDGRGQLTPALRTWLRRALQLDARGSFKSTLEAKVELENLIAGEDTSGAVVALVARCHESSQPPPMANRPAPVPVVAQPPAASPMQVRYVPHVEHSPMAGRHVDPPAPEEIEELPMPMSDARRPRANNRMWVAALLFMATAGVLFAGQRYFSQAGVRIQTGTLSITTNPAGAEVIVDGQPRGQSPLNLSMTPGAHSVVVRGEGEPRTIPITIVAGATSAQYLDLPKAAATTGVLQISSDPPGAKVTVDGVARGTAPLTLNDLTVGQHSLTLENEVGSVTHAVTIAPDAPVSLVVPLGAPQGAPVSGWISVSAPVDMQLFEQGRLLGSSSIDRIMLPAGRHEIEIVSEPLAFRATRSVQVSPGRMASIAVPLPAGVVSLNATPWANVSIDGQDVGETPIGNLSVQIGPHEFIFRNPQLGEQRRAVTLTMREPMRISVDMTKK